MGCIGSNGLLDQQLVGRAGEGVTVISTFRCIGRVAGNVEDGALDGHIGGV